MVLVGFCVVFIFMDILGRARRPGVSHGVRPSIFLELVRPWFGVFIFMNIGGEVEGVRRVLVRQCPRSPGSV